MRFALMQVKTGLCHMLSRFEVAPCKETPVTIDLDKKKCFCNDGRGGSAVLEKNAVLK